MSLLDKKVRAAITDIRREFREEFSRDPRQFRERLIRNIKASLPLRVGRPRKEMITTASRMHADGAKWAAVFKACLSPDLSGAERRVQELNLRCAVCSRGRADRRKKTADKSSLKKKDRTYF